MVEGRIEYDPRFVMSVFCGMLFIGSLYKLICLY